MDKEYWTECDICDIVTFVMLEEGDDVPRFCPMCGEDSEFEETEDD